MDYEQKYKKALEKAKKLYGKYCIDDVLESLFPELQESEDEKVKRIIHSISNKISFHLHDIFTEEEFQCFDAWSNAWLKKQDEQKSKWSEEDEELCQDTLDVFEALGNGLDPLEDYHKLYDWMRTIKQRLEEQQ